jgi:hypothetical protein
MDKESIVNESWLHRQLMKIDPRKESSGWHAFFALIGVALLFVLMAAGSLNEDFQFSTNEIVVTVIIILFTAINGLFILQLTKFVAVSRNRNSFGREFAIACMAAMLNIILFTAIFYVYGIDSGMEMDPVKNDIQSSLYFSIVTWTTLGYGDLKPIPELRLVAAFEALLGYVYMSILVGIFLSSMTKKHKS